MEDTIETSALDQRQELRDAGVVAIIGTYSGEGDDPKVVNRVAETLKESLGSEFVQRYLGESEPVRIFEKSGKLSYGSNEVTVILSENQSRIWGAESEVGFMARWTSVRQAHSTSSSRKTSPAWIGATRKTAIPFLILMPE